MVLEGRHAGAAASGRGDTHVLPGRTGPRTCVAAAQVPWAPRLGEAARCQPGRAGVDAGGRAPQLAAAAGAGRPRAAAARIPARVRRRPEWPGLRDLGLPGQGQLGQGRLRDRLPARESVVQATPRTAPVGNGVAHVRPRRRPRGHTSHLVYLQRLCGSERRGAAAGSAVCVRPDWGFQRSSWARQTRTRRGSDKPGLCLCCLPLGLPAGLWGASDRGHPGAGRLHASLWAQQEAAGAAAALGAGDAAAAGAPRGPGLQSPPWEQPQSGQRPAAGPVSAAGPQMQPAQRGGLGQAPRSARVLLSCKRERDVQRSGDAVIAPAPAGPEPRPRSLER